MYSLSFCTTLAAFILPAAVDAGPLPSTFSLGRYVPNTVWMYLHFVDNPEARFIEEEWAEVFEALKKTGIDRDLMTLLAKLTPEENKAEVEAKVEKVTELLKRVDWSDLFAQEMAYAQRVVRDFEGGTVPYDYFLLTRGKPATGEKNMEALVALARELTSWSEKVAFVKTSESVAEVWSLEFSDVDDKEDVPGVYLLRKGDIIGLLVGRRALTDFVRLADGEPGKGSMDASDRFREALATVKAPEMGFVYFDIRRLLGDLGQMFESIAKREGEMDAEGEKWLPVIRKGTALLDVAEYVISTIEIDGRRQLTHEVTLLAPGAKESPVVRVFADRKPFERFDRYVPANATGFSVSGFFNLQELYDLVIRFVKEDIPDGAELIETLNATLAEWGFDPHRDVFSWLSGECISVNMPAEVVTPMGGSAWVGMVRVKDSALASQKLDAALNWLAQMVQQWGQPLMIIPTEVAGENFKELNYPMFAMFFKPVVGVKDEWLMLGTSPAAINKCLAVAAGDAPSVVTNERFKKEGLIPSGPVHSVSFTDTSNFGQDLAAAVGIVGMVGGMISAQIPDEEGKSVARTIMAMILKLGPVLQKIDFYSSEAAMTTVDLDNRIIRTEYIVTYKPPAPKAPDTPDTSEAEASTSGSRAPHQ